MHTRGRGGERKGQGGHRQFCLPKFAHVGLSRGPQVRQKKPLDLTHLRFESRSRTTRSRFLESFALPDEAVELQSHHSTTQHNSTPDTTQHNTTQLNSCDDTAQHTAQHTQHSTHTYNITRRQRDSERRQRMREKRKDKTRDKTRKTRQDKTRQERQDKTRQDKTRQDKTRQDKTADSWLPSKRCIVTLVVYPRLFRISRRFDIQSSAREITLCQHHFKPSWKKINTKNT